MRYFLTCIIALVAGSWLHTASAEEANYLLGSGDVLKISVYNNPDLSLETRVTERGTISFPLVGELHLGGITLSAAEKKIAGLLESGGFVKQPQVNIMVEQFQSKLVSVMGQVNRPGKYPVVSGTHTVGDFLGAAGGINPTGSDTVTVTTLRDGKLSHIDVDVDNLFRTGDNAANIVLENGDSVYVPRAPMFYIYGEVQRPGSFRLERNMTIIQALALGGGPTARGTQRNIQLHRRNVNGVVEKLSPALTDPVQQDDVIYVQESLFQEAT